MISGDVLKYRNGLIVLMPASYETALARSSPVSSDNPVPAYIRSDNGPEFVAQTVRDWIAAVGASTAYIEPGSPWENGYCESFNARFRDELLNGEIFYSLKEAQILIEQWRRHYNTKRPHSALGYRPPATETIIPMDQRPIMH